MLQSKSSTSSITGSAAVLLVVCGWEDIAAGDAEALGIPGGQKSACAEEESVMLAGRGFPRGDRVPKAGGTLALTAVEGMLRKGAGLLECLAGF